MKKVLAKKSKKSFSIYVNLKNYTYEFQLRLNIKKVIQKKIKSTLL